MNILINTKIFNTRNSLKKLNIVNNQLQIDNIFFI